ncbi:hypothetical protein BJ944DRAFT_274073, partial [Cunninghamella echinulata]
KIHCSIKFKEKNNKKIRDLQYQLQSLELGFYELQAQYEYRRNWVHQIEWTMRYYSEKMAVYEKKLQDYQSRVSRHNTYAKSGPWVTAKQHQYFDDEKNHLQRESWNISKTLMDTEATVAEYRNDLNLHRNHLQGIENGLDNIFHEYRQLDSLLQSLIDKKNNKKKNENKKKDKKDNYNSSGGDYPSIIQSLDSTKYCNIVKALLGSKIFPFPSLK